MLSSDGVSVVHLAARSGSADTVKIALELLPSHAHFPDSLGTTAFQIAKMWGYDNCLAELDKSFEIKSTNKQVFSSQFNKAFSNKSKVSFYTIEGLSIH